jgi:hypothetical protein
LLGEHTRTIAPARTLADETLTLERALSNLVNQAYALNLLEVERLDRIRNPSKYLGK